MTTKLAAALAAGTLAVGILVGAAGTVLVTDATNPSMGDMTQMHQMMDMMGDDSQMPMQEADPAEHERHHPDADQ